MEITSSYGVEIRKVNVPVSLTYRIYREAVRVLALFYDTVWEELSTFTDRKELWGGHLWNPSYCAVTVSDRSREQVERYILTQKDRA